MKAQLMLKTLTAEEIAKAVGGKLEIYGDGTLSNVTNITYDSRDVCKGSLFCAIKGERADGHNFIADVVAKGAVLILANKIPQNAKSTGNFAAVIVDDTVAALGLLAGYYRTFSKAKVIGITGSVGKTTTKDFVASVTNEAFNTLKTEGNHNNEIGLPMTIFGLTPECEIAVLEMGMSARGEISFMTKLVKPEIAVITNIGTSHIASLGSRENICEAKLEITDGMTKDGVLIINADEPLLTDRKNEIVPNLKLMGIYNRNADYKAINIRTASDGTVFDILYGSNAVINVEIPVLGRHNVYNALAAYSVGVTLGMKEQQIRQGLKNFVGTEMRQKIYDVGKFTVIEDCYNASPESMRAAIEVLCSKAQKSGSQPCALLGDMLELGENSRLMHDQLGQFAAQMKVQRLYCFGEMAEAVAEAAIKKGIRADSVYVCSDVSTPEVMADMILSSISEGDVLLVKASRGIAAERVLDIIKEKISKRKN